MRPDRWAGAGSQQAFQSKVCKGLLEFKAMEWSSQMAFSKDIIWLPCGKWVGGSKTGEQEDSLWSARARGWPDRGNDKGHGEGEGLEGFGELPGCGERLTAGDEERATPISGLSCSRKTMVVGGRYFGMKLVFWNEIGLRCLGTRITSRQGDTVLRRHLLKIKIVSEVH